MYIYKLRYNDRATAINDLIAKGVLVEANDLNNNTAIVNSNITQAVVELGIIVLTDGTYDSNNNVITEPTYADGYHFDIMVTTEIDFGTARVTPTNVKHAFLGFNTNEYNQINPNTNTNETTTY
jgi:hypothetical protein